LISKENQRSPLLLIGCSGWSYGDTPDKGGWTEVKRSLGIGIFDQMILALVNLLNSRKYHFPKGVEYLSAAHTFILTDKNTAKTALDLFFKALYELPEETRKIVIAHEKAGIESRFVLSQPSKDWERKWLENLTKYDTLVLYAVCQNKECKRRCYPVYMPYCVYREKLVS
jgi:hypothetical protein